MVFIYCRAIIPIPNTHLKYAIKTFTCKLYSFLFLHTVLIIETTEAPTGKTTRLHVRTRYHSEQLPVLHLPSSLFLLQPLLPAPSSQPLSPWVWWSYFSSLVWLYWHLLWQWVLWNGKRWGQGRSILTHLSTTTSSHEEWRRLKMGFIMKWLLYQWLASNWTSWRQRRLTVIYFTATTRQEEGRGRVLRGSTMKWRRWQILLESRRGTKRSWNWRQWRRNSTRPCMEDTKAKT